MNIKMCQCHVIHGEGYREELRRMSGREPEEWDVLCECETEMTAEDLLCDGCRQGCKTRYGNQLRTPPNVWSNGVRAEPPLITQRGSLR